MNKAYSFKIDHAGIFRNSNHFQKKSVGREGIHEYANPINVLVTPLPLITNYPEALLNQTTFINSLSDLYI